MRYDSIIDSIGHTPLVRLRLPAPDGVEAYAKLELQNLFGMKDRVAARAITQARKIGELTEGAPIVESSSGTMALGLALVGRALGHPVHIVTDPRIDPITLAKLESLGCEVHVVAAMSGQGWQSARLELLDQLVRDLPGAFWPRQYSNPDNPGAYRHLAEELIADAGPIDVLVGSVGSGGSLCGTARVLRDQLPDLRVVGVDCVGSVLFDQPDVPQRLQSGLGNSLHPANLDFALIDEVHWLNDREAFEATSALAAEQQIFAGNTSGSVYRVMSAIAAGAAPGTRIVGILPDRGDRYVDTVYSSQYRDGRDLGQLECAAAPSPVSYGTTVGSWSRASVPDPEAGRCLLFIESNTTGTGMLALRAAGRLGLRPVLLSDDPSRYAGLEDEQCEVVRSGTSSVPEVRAAVRERFAGGTLAGVTTTSDFYAAMAADVADWLRLPGNTPQAVRTCRDKAALRAALTVAGLSQPRFAAVTSLDAVPAAVAAVSLPCVVKPADDSGSNNVLLCHTLDEVAEQVKVILAITTNVRGQATARTALIEQYLDAPEYSVEMFSWRGQAHCVGITEKHLAGPPYFVETGHLFPAELPLPDGKLVRALVEQTLAVAGITFGPTHTEVKLTGAGPAILEVNPRLAGGMIPELVRLSTGVDLLEQQLRAATGLAPALEPSQAPAISGIRFLLAGRPGPFSRVDGVAEAAKIPGVRQVRVTAKPGAQVRPPRNAYDRLGFIIATGTTSQQVTATLDAAADACTVVVGQ